MGYGIRLPKARQPSGIAVDKRRMAKAGSLTRGAFGVATLVALQIGCGHARLAQALPQLVLDARCSLHRDQAVQQPNEATAGNASASLDQRLSSDWGARAWLIWSAPSPAKPSDAAFAGNPTWGGAWRSSRCDMLPLCAWQRDMQYAALAEVLEALGDEAAAP